MSSGSGCVTPVVPIIMAGGVGSRLWPLSREQYPKQFLHGGGGETTLFQDTLLRVAVVADRGAVPGLHPPIIACNEEHRFLVQEQLRLIRKIVGKDPNLMKHAATVCPETTPIFLEPVGRNTAPALCAIAMIQQTMEADPVLLLLPSDHLVPDREEFALSIAEAVRLAQDGKCIVTVGIRATKTVETYGHIRRGSLLNGEEGAAPKSSPLTPAGEIPAKTRSPRPGKPRAYAISRFIEKPKAEAAYIVTGDGTNGHHQTTATSDGGPVPTGFHYWNSGVYAVRASLFVSLLRKYHGEMVHAVQAAMDNRTVDGVFIRPGKVQWDLCPSDSIDYAVMEHIGDSSSKAPAAVKGAVVELRAEWSDVATWQQFADASHKDRDGNVVEGDVLNLHSNNNVVIAKHRLVTCVGCQDMIVVETPDAVLVAPKTHSEEVRDLVNELKARKRTEYASHRRVYRPWGNYEGLDVGRRYQVKRLVVNPGQQLSLQMHYHRAEHWIVVNGTAMVTRGNEKFVMTENQSTYISIGQTHRLENPGCVPLEIIEVQSGSYVGEDDIVRFEDIYNRVPKAQQQQSGGPNAGASCSASSSSSSTVATGCTTPPLPPIMAPTGGPTIPTPISAGAPTAVHQARSPRFVPPPLAQCMIFPKTSDHPVAEQQQPQAPSPSAAKPLNLMQPALHQPCLSACSSPIKSASTAPDPANFP